MATKRYQVSVDVKTFGTKKAAQDFAGISGGAKRATASVTSLLSPLKAMGGLVAAIGIGRLVREMGSLASKSIELARNQRQAGAQLAAAVRSTGEAAGFTVKQLQEQAQALQKVTTFGDETVMSAQGILLTFTKIAGDALPRATEATLDIATRMKTDLRSAALQVGKALNDPIRGLDGLSRAGIQFSDDQKKVIKALAESGDMASAQALILKELETQFGGSARAAREQGGQIQALENSWGDFLEKLGETFEVFDPLIDLMTETFTGGSEDASKWQIALVFAFGAVQIAAAKTLEWFERVQAISTSMVAGVTKQVSKVVPALRGVAEELQESAKRQAENADAWREYAKEVEQKVIVKTTELAMGIRFLANESNDAARAAEELTGELKEQKQAQIDLLDVQIRAVEASLEQTKARREEALAVAELKEHYEELFQAMFSPIIANGTADVGGFLPNAEDVVVVPELERMNEEVEELNDNSEEWLQTMVSVGQTLAAMFDESDKGFANMIRALTSIVAAYKQIDKSAENITAQNVMAGAQFGAAVAGFSQQLGIFKGQRGTGGFGGQLSGDYSSVGGMVGGAIGTAVAPGIGTVIGSVIGTFVGGMIKSGADEALSAVSGLSGEISATISKVEGNMGNAIRTLTDGVADSINRALDVIGADLIKGAKIEFKIRDDVISVFVNGIKGSFDNIQDAIKFAVNEFFKTAELDTSQLSENMAAVLAKAKEGVFSTLEEFVEALDIAKKVDLLGIGSTARGLSQAIEQLEQLSMRITDLGGSAANVEAEISRVIDAERDAILGIVPTYEEQIRLRAAEFNALLMANGMLDQLITEEEILSAVRRNAAKAANGARRAERESFEDFVADIIRGDLNPFEALIAENEEAQRRLDEGAQKFKKSAEEAARASEILGERLREDIARTAEDMFISLGERLAEMAGDEEALAAFQELRFQLELAQLLVQIDMLRAIGVLSDAEIDVLYGLLDQVYAIQDAVDDIIPYPGRPYPRPGDPDYPGRARTPRPRPDRPDIPPYGGGGGGGSLNDNLLEAARRELDRWRNMSLSPFALAMQELEESFDRIRAALGNTTEVQEAYNQALRDTLEKFLKPLVDFQNSLLRDSRFSPLKLQDRFDEALREFVAASGDVDRLAELPDLARIVLDLGRELFPLGSQSYLDLFEQINSILDDVRENLDPAGLSDPLLEEARLARTQQVDELQLLRAGVAETNARLASIENSLYRSRVY